jgi:hypothetical protein
VNVEDRKDGSPRQRLRDSEVRIRELRERIAVARGRGADTADSEALLKLLEDAHEWFAEDLALHSVGDRGSKPES